MLRIRVHERVGSRPGALPALRPRGPFEAATVPREHRAPPSARPARSARSVPEATPLSATQPPDAATLRDFALRQERLRDQERRGSARELHDEPGHLLKAARLLMSPALEGALARAALIGACVARDAGREGGREGGRRLRLRLPRASLRVEQTEDARQAPSGAPRTPPAPATPEGAP